MPTEPCGEPAALARVAQPAVGGADRLLEDDRDARRLVVVVLAPDRVGDEPARVARLAAHGARDVTTRYRLPLVRALEPVVGSVTRTASAELESRSSSDDQPVLERQPGRHGRRV